MHQKKRFGFSASIALFATALALTPVQAQTEAAPVIPPMTVEEFARPVDQLSVAQKLEFAERSLLADDGRDLDYGFKLILPLAFSGNRDAVRLLAKAINSNPYKFSDDTPKVLRALGNEAMFGSSSAIIAWANIHDRGLDVPVDHAKAYDWYRWAAVIGSDTGRRLTSIALAEGRGVAQNTEEAVAWADRIVPARRAQTYMQLAKIFSASGSLQNLELSADLAIKAAGMQPAYAMEAAKLLRMDGISPEKAALADAMMQKAVEVGDPSALLLSAQDLASSTDTQDLNKMIDIYGGLVELGNADAIAGLSNVLKQMDATVSMKEAAIQVLTASADKQNMDAIKTLSNAYFQGIGTTTSYTLAAKYYQQASDLGDAESQYQLGQMYANGLGVQQDLQKARSLFETSAAGGYKLAQASLMALNP